MDYKLHQIVKYPRRHEVVDAEIVAIDTVTRIDDNGESTSYKFVLRLKDDFSTIVGEAPRFTLDRYNKFAKV